MTDSGERGPVVWHEGLVGDAQRREAFGHGGATLWFTGLSGSGKSTISVAVESLLTARRVRCVRLDGDNLRHGLNGDLGFGAEDRDENVRRAGEVAGLLAASGVVCLACLISPMRAQRERVRAAHERAGAVFGEVFVDTPLEECERRDPKGLYKRARAGEIKGFTGIDDPYESPTSAELVLRTGGTDVGSLAGACVEWLEARGVL